MEKIRAYIRERSEITVIRTAYQQCNSTVLISREHWYVYGFYLNGIWAWLGVVGGSVPQCFSFVLLEFTISNHSHYYPCFVVPDLAHELSFGVFNLHSRS